jgi:ppGpp synthetase/RelA/SpoT-type nucleotidyltranferase
MKINSRVRDLHEAAAARYRRLSEEVKEKLAPRCDEQGWFYRARVKSLESFALKLETGRIENPSAPEDFFACTVVVQTQAQLQQAEDLVLSLFDLHERKPPNDQETYKEPSNFVFDDLRLYVRRRESASSRNQDLTGLQFEVQLKTILQYAWGVATHDLVYKTDTVSWPKSRIAFQVKAMLEHAELAIAEAATLARGGAIAKQDGRTADILKVIAAVERIWPDDALPADRKRLAENIQLALRIGDKKADDLVELVEAERRRVGLLPRNLSPYAFVVQALANSQVVNLERKLGRSGRAKLVVHDEMDLPAWMAVTHDRIIHLGRDGQA